MAGWIILAIFIALLWLASATFFVLAVLNVLGKLHRK